MSCHAEAQQAIDEQGKLNRVGTDIYVNFRYLNTDKSTHEQEKMETTKQNFPSSKFREIKLPEPGSMYDDGLSKVSNVHQYLNSLDSLFAF